MADEYNTSTSWWDSSRARYETVPSTTASPTLHNNLASFGWPTEMVDIKSTSTRSTIDSTSLSDNNSPDPTSLDFHMIGLGLSSPSMDWNHALFRGEKTDVGLRSILQENMNYQQEINNRGGFSLDHQQQQLSSPHGNSSDQSGVMDSSSLYTNNSTMFQGLLGSSSTHQHQPCFDDQSMNYRYPSNYGGVCTNDEIVPSWSSKIPVQFLRSSDSPPKQQNQLQFSNNTPYWNASANATGVRPGYFQLSSQPQFSTPNFNEKTKNICEGGDSSLSSVKKSGGESGSKRSRNETSPSPLPAFKVRKEKMGDRISALQQLVSPFGKTDTASVLSEAIEYIKFLHEQVTVLSTPYMKSGASLHHQQSSSMHHKTKDSEGPKPDLRSRGLCLVPISSTFPVTHETTVDFWTPTFGGTFR